MGQVGGMGPNVRRRPEAVARHTDRMKLALDVPLARRSPR